MLSIELFDWAGGDMEDFVCRARDVVMAGVVAGFILAPAAGWAGPMQDQIYTPKTALVDGGFSSGAANSSRTAETFTVGITGTLDEVEVYNNKSSVTFSGVNILSTSGGIPTTTILGTGSFVSNTGSKGTYLASFTVSLSVTAGEVLAIEPFGPSVFDQWVGDTGTAPNDDEAYNLNPMVGITSFKAENNVFGYVTFVDSGAAVAEPASVGLLGLGFIGLAGLHRRRTG